VLLWVSVGCCGGVSVEEDWCRRLIIQVFNAALWPERTYLWAGMQVTAVQLVTVRLALDFLVFAQGGRLDYAAHLGGAACGYVCFLHIQNGGALPYDALMAMMIA
jgi:hypothetical protein